MGKTRTVGNGEGTLYYSDSLRRWIFQYFVNGKRMSIKQRNKESTRDFKIRVTKLKNELNTGSYIEISQETLKTIIKRHINQKFNDGITKGTSYKRDCETLQSIEKCCSDFIDKPIQKVSLRDLQKSKENMKEYSQSVINKMYCS